MFFDWEYSMNLLNCNLQNCIAHLGEGVSLPNKQRNYCKVDNVKLNMIAKEREKALPYIDVFLRNAKTEEQITDGLLVIDKMLDENVKGVDKLYPTLSKFNDTSSPTIQVMLSGIYRKTLIPDAFGPLCKMLIKQSLSPNSPYFDPTEEIGGAIYEYLRKK